MLTVPPLMDVASTITVACTDVALTSDQLATLKTELTTDPIHLGYAGKPEAAVVVLLCSHLAMPNPTPRGTVPRTSWLMADFYNFLLGSVAPDGETPLIVSFQQAAVGSDQLKAISAQNALNLINSPLAEVDLTDTQVLAGLSALLTEGLINDTIHTAILNEPDANWQPNLNVSRLSQLTGFTSGQVVTLAEVNTALA